MDKETEEVIRGFLRKNINDRENELAGLLVIEDERRLAMTIRIILNRCKAVVAKLMEARLKHKSKNKIIPPNETESGPLMPDIPLYRNYPFRMQGSYAMWHPIQ